MRFLDDETKARLTAFAASKGQKFGPWLRLVAIEAAERPVLDYYREWSLRLPEVEEIFAKARKAADRAILAAVEELKERNERGA